MKWPQGCTSAGASGGIKRSGPDVGIIVFDEPVAWAGTFTRNAAAAAPVKWSRSRIGSPARAVVVNSGNANACTGPAGDRTVADVVAATARALGCAAEDILVASTGPIGRVLPSHLVTNALPALLSSLDIGADGFSEAILTTDTVPKTATAEGASFSVAGVAKGAAMIAPSMATMLAFVVTDADLSAPQLQDILAGAVSRTFNRISIDACESTNDSVFLFGTGQREADASELADAITDVCGSLAEQIVRDAEGGTKFVRISVAGAGDDDAAANLGRAVADSVLWRAAVHGGDANWGRIASALGSADRALDLDALTVSLNGVAVFEAGAPAETPQPTLLAGPEIDVECTVGTGPGHATILSADISAEYVALNAEGTS